jgi:hypothetical protein
MIYGVIFDSVLIAIATCALVWGAGPERIGALVNVGATAASSALRLTGLASWQAGGPTVLIDAGVAATFFWLGCRSSRFWPIWSFGFVLALVAVDLIKLALPRIDLFTFATGQFAYAYLALLSLAFGTASAARAPRDPLNGYRPPCPIPAPPTPTSNNS